MFSTSTFGEAFELIVTGGMVTLVMGVMVAIPLLVQYYIEERRGEDSE